MSNSHIKVRKCADCPFWNQFGSERMMECTHPNSPKKEYENLLGWDQVRGSVPIPKWCPLKIESYHETIIVNGEVKSERIITIV